MKPSGDEVASLANQMEPFGGEVEGINEAINVEECGKWRGGNNWDFWKFKTLWLHEEGKENREKEKEKKIELKGYFL